MFERGNREGGRPAENDSHPLRHLPLALFPELLDFPFDQVALQHAEVLQKKDSVEVIDLMAERPRKQVFPANFKGLALRLPRERPRDSPARSWLRDSFPRSRPPPRSAGSIRFVAQPVPRPARRTSRRTYPPLVAPAPRRI